MSGLANYGDFYEPMVRRDYDMSWDEYVAWTENHLTECDQDNYGFEGCLHQPPPIWAGSTPLESSGAPDRDHR